MNDTLDKTSSSSLAVVEKKPHRPGGCVGIFFQLFDWNRRFATKKLFSKKLLAPVRLKQPSKKFGGDEKQPKLRLIADENRGGFPTAKNNADIQQHQEMRAPGLVAKLMGLDSMPASQRDKLKKFRAPSNHDREKTDKFVDDSSGYTRGDPNVDNGGGTKQQFVRPQKLQKTSVSERQPVIKFGQEKLPPVKSILSKPKKQHPKLPSPLKSPRNIPRKSSSKLIGAAARILEASGRPKNALTYTNTLYSSLKESTHSLSSGPLEDVDGAGHRSCRNCGYRLNNFDSKDKSLIFAPPFSSCVGPSCHGSQRSKLGNSVFYHEELQKNYNGDLHSRVKFMSSKSSFGGPIQKNVNNVNGANKFVSFSQGLSHGTARPRLPARMSNGKFEPEKRFFNSQDDSVPPGRKRRPANVSGHVVSSNINRTNGFHDPQERAGNGQVENNVVSFTFNSPVKSKSGGIREVSERRNENGGTKSGKPFPLSGDALGALLQQKLKELTFEGEGMGGNVFRKTTSSILQELISALASEKQDNLAAISDRRRNIWCDNYRKLSNSAASPTSSQANAIAFKTSIEQPLSSERPSPGSVLEAYFSTESCRSSSLDENRGCKMLNESTDRTYYEYRSPNPSSELLDSAASMNSSTAKSGNQSVSIDILNHISEISRCNIFANCGLKGNKLGRAKNALLNAELVLHNAVISGAMVGKGCPIKHLLLHELETLASLLWMNFGNSLGIEDGKEASQLKKFALDSVVEYMDERFGGYLKGCGSKVSSKLPLRMNTNTLIFEIVEVVKRWEELSRHDNLDELIGREMGFSSRDWTECETEGFEIGLEVSGNVVQVLVDEIVMELLWEYA